MAGLFRRLRRARPQDPETDPGDPHGTAPVDGEDTDTVSEPDPEGTAEGVPLAGLPPIDAREEPPAHPADPGAAIAVPAPALPPAAPAPPPAPSAPAPPPVPPSPAPAVTRAPAPPKRLEPPLPRPDALDPVNSVPPGTRSSCFLCGTPLEAGGRCPGCQMTWVE